MKPALHSVLTLLLLSGCTQLVPQPKPERPSITILSPASDTAVPFNTSFHLSATARAHEGTLSQVHIVLRGAVSSQRTIPLFGSTQAIEVDLVVPQDALVGPDHIALDVLLLVEANVDGRTVVGPPTGLTLSLVDRSSPTVEIFSPEALTPDAGFDLQVPSGRPFTLGVRAEDAIGGITELGIDAPAVLGGLRTHRLPASRSARFEVILSPPAHADFEVEVFAVDAARAPNRTTRKVRIRVGDGGRDELPPQVRIEVPAAIECGRVATATVSAEDLDSGIERVQVSVDGLTETTYANLEAVMSTMTLTLDLDGRSPAGRSLSIEASARDLFGQFSATASAAVPIVDTTGPRVVARFEPVIIPGRTSTLTVSAQDTCGDLATAQLTLTDGTGTATTVVTQIGSAILAGPVAFAVPANLCASTPVQASLRILDDAGNASATTQVRLPARDLIGPKISPSLLAPSGGLSPGQSAPLQVDLVDFGSAIRSSTVTVTLVGTSYSGNLLVRSARWPDGGCTGPRAQSLSMLVSLPSDLILSGQATIQIDVQAEDHSGQVARQQLQVPIVDRVSPRLRFVAPAPGTVFVQGSSQTVVVAASDLHTNLSQVTLRINGPATVNGQSEWTQPLQTRSATVSFVLVTDRGAPLDATIELQATALDSATPPNLGRAAVLQSRTCGQPTLASISPSVGPVAGGNEVRVFGQGFSPGLSIRFGRQTLENVRVLSSSVAMGRVPALGQPAGSVDVEIINACGSQQALARLVLGYRFVAPPQVRLMRPSNTAGIEPGATVFVVAAAVADGLPLTEIGAELSGTRAVQPSSNASEALDAVFLASATATVAPELLVWAIDSLGQRTELRRALPLDGAQSQSLKFVRHSGPVGVAETSGFEILSRGRDDRLRNVTLSATVTSNRPDLLLIMGPGALRGVSVGTATVQVDFGGQQSTLQVRVLDDALVTDLRPLLLSPLLPVGTSSLGGVTLAVQHLTAGLRTDVSPQIALSVQPSRLAQVINGRVVATSTGSGFIDISWAGRNLRRALWIRTQLDVPPGASVVVPGGQRFAGGQVDGEVHGGGISPWTISVDAGETLNISPTGILQMSSPGLGVAGPGGRAGAAPGQVRCSLACGASGAGLFAGGGGGSLGAGGDGGGSPASGGQPSSSEVGGGGASAGSLGGGAGGVARLEMPSASLVFNGIIDLCGGTGTSAPLSTGLGAGGAGAGGQIVIEVQDLQGQGLIRICGGVGGSGTRSGGGAGGGGVQIRAGQASVFIDVDRAGGFSGIAGGSAASGQTGQPGTTNR